MIYIRTIPKWGINNNIKVYMRLLMYITADFKVQLQ